MTDVQRRKAAAKFAAEWKDRGRERAECQPFWLSLLRDVCCVAMPEKHIVFDEPVELDNKSFIDCIINETRVLIEHKSLGVDLSAKSKQSDGSMLTPYEQGKRYADWLPRSKQPFWIVACNFSEFWIYDMENPKAEPEKILLEDLEHDYHRLNFLVDVASANVKKEKAISLEAGELVGKLYDELLKQYKNPESPESLRSLNMLCVRLVFCLYAEDAGIFGSRTQFRDYIRKVATKDIEDVRCALLKLFNVLNIERKDRDPYMRADLAAFPFANGGLFDDTVVEIPHFNDKIVSLLLQDAADGFNWSKISPTIFGAVFESTLNPDTRRAGGMHYTSILNIHKVIDPLFLDELKAELEEIKSKKQRGTRNKSLTAFQEKLSALSFLDPACGSGNFLTETYIFLRRLENEVLKLLYDDGQIVLDTGKIIKVSIGQFYGFEINDFAVTVAKTALWIAESQMMKETEDIVNMNLDFLPLRSYANIIECNALRIDWEEFAPKAQLNYVMGNPPFVGFTYMTARQKEDMELVFPKVKNLDYVSAWYMRAAEYIQGTKIECAFVSTNSLCQGESVPTLWKRLLPKGLVINYAYRTFVWDSETKGKAAVHCVIIGFSLFNRKEKWIFDNEEVIAANNINPYLLDGENIIVESRSKAICDVPAMVYGNKPADGGNLIIEEADYDDFINKEPLAKKYIKKLIGSTEYINNKKRYCLWLVEADPADLRKMPLVMERIEKCRQMRNNSIAAGIRKFAETPTLFAQVTQPQGADYIVVPRVSSERRDYIPIGFLTADVIVNDAVQIVPNATIYHFGILTSSVHMIWMKMFCGRLKSDFRYSRDIVYNTFPWIDVTVQQKSAIEKLAEAVLEARKLYLDKGNSLADLYDPLTMPKDLRKAHKALDKAVMKLYGFSAGTSESEVVAGLMARYRGLVGK